MSRWGWVLRFLVFSVAAQAATSARSFDVLDYLLDRDFTAEEVETHIVPRQLSNVFGDAITPYLDDVSCEGIAGNPSRGPEMFWNCVVMTSCGTPVTISAPQFRYGVIEVLPSLNEVAMYRVCPEMIRPHRLQRAADQAEGRS